MGILKKALNMLEKHPLCDHCLGRQFALLGHGIENDERGKAIKLVLTFKAHVTAAKNKDSVKALKVLALNGFSKPALQLLQKKKKRVPKKSLAHCFLCEDKFGNIGATVKQALTLLVAYEYTTFLVGIELPTEVEEREDEFKATFEVNHGENLRNEFGRLIGKKIAEANGKSVDFLKPEIVVLVNPYVETVKLQVNPLFASGRYRKLVRDIPQSKWFCSSCRGKGCKKCGWTGKMYPESVEEIIGKPFLEATGGEESFFHASGREDIDARMLGSGRPFVVEVSKPRKRFVDLKVIEAAVNAGALGKVEVSGLTFANKDDVRKLKKGENAQKEYALLAEFERELSDSDLRLIEEKFSGIT